MNEQKGTKNKRPLRADGPPGRSPFFMPKKLRKPYSLKSEKANAAIRQLIEEAGGSEHSDLLAQMITTVIKLEDEKVERGDLKILNTTLKELRWAFKVYRPYRDQRKVTVFGSARTKSSDLSFLEAKKFGKLMAGSDWMVITGGSGGIMHAGNLGAGKANSFGANIILPCEQAANSVIEDDKKMINFKYFFTRKLIFVKESDAICLFPGGFGTLDELFEVLTLVQTGKMMPRPIVLVEPRGYTYWKNWNTFIKNAMLKNKMIDHHDLHLFDIVRNAKTARDRIVHFYKNFHSMRFAGDYLVLRLKRELTPKELGQINSRFKDILTKGKIEPSIPLAGEESETQIAELPRLICYFDRRSYGRLKQMIDSINDMGE